MQAHPTKTVGDSMRYHSLVAVTAAAISLVLPSAAAAQSRPQQHVRFVLQQTPRLAPDKDLQLAPASDFQLGGSQELRLAPDQRTKSAAYKWEAGFLALSALDAAETISCLNRNRCTEGNFIWGRHPSTGTIIAAKLGLGLVHFAAFKVIADHDPHTALRAAQISAAVQGGVVLLNMHKAF
jgi:hypothetical protein